MIDQLLDHPGCERIKDFYSVGPVQRAAVESLIDAVISSIVIALKELPRFGSGDRKEWEDAVISDCISAVKDII